MKHPYERVLVPEADGGFSAYISEFEGCLAEGETSEEALKNLESTALAWIDAEQEAGREIPGAWNVQEYSGKLLLRLPKSLHMQLARHASKDGVSLNQHVVRKLAEGGKENQILSLISRLLQDHAAQIYKIYSRIATSSEEAPSLSSRGEKRQVDAAKLNPTKSIGRTSFSVGRNAKTGRLESVADARRYPSTSHVERMPKPGNRLGKK